MDLLLFDFDGVIVNTFPFALEILRELQDPNLTEDEFRDWFNGNVYEKMDESILPRFFELYTERLMETPPTPGIVELVTLFHQNGRKLAIVSSTYDGPIKKFLTFHGIDSSFTKIYGGNESKSKVVKLNEALVDFDCTTKNTRFITDTLGDIREATKAGITSIAVTWGYHPQETLAQGNPSAIINRPDELPALLKNDATQH